MKRHRVLVVGVGSIGERHVRCLRATGRADVGICEPSTPLRERIAGDYHVEEAFADLDDALVHPWDSAVIATPAHTHIALAGRAVEAGVAPLIEKPLAVEEEGVDTLLQALASRGLPCGVAYVYRAHPALGAMRSAIETERFGRPLQAVVVGGQHFPTYRPAYASTYYADHAKGGGLIQDGLPHLINATEWLVGPMTRVLADSAHLKLPGVSVEDTVHAIARHGQVPASYSLNQHQAPNETSITVVCESGTCRFELHQHRWGWMTEPDTPWQIEATDFESRDDWFTKQEHAWLDVLDGRAEPLCSLAEAWQTLRATRAVLASAASAAGWIDITRES
jgi:predicted dehydrogenase